MLERVSGWSSPAGGVRDLGDDGRDPASLRAGDWVGFRSRFWAVLLRPDGAAALEPRLRGGRRARLADEPGRALVALHLLLRARSSAAC